MSVVDDSELEFDLKPQSVSAYLLATGWTLSNARPGIETWDLLEGSKLSARVSLPTNPKFDDFRLRYDEALERLRVVNDWTSTKLVSAISTSRSDMMYIRADQAVLDGTIPLKQAAELLSGARMLLTNAASAALSPRAHYLGRRADLVNEFVDEDIRMGHTKRGSFIITILARLDDPEEVVAPVETEGEVSEETDAVAPFQRRVMAKLATGVQAARSISLSPSGLTLDEAIDDGLSANTVEALPKMTRFQGLHSLDLSFSWAVAEKAEPPDVDVVAISRDVIPNLEGVRQRLVRRPASPTTETITGRVTRLERGEDDAEGTVTIIGITDRSTHRQIRVALTGVDYNTAISAHRRKSIVSATGILERRSNAMWLTGRVTLSVLRR